jgi:hypothetical protein
MSEIFGNKKLKEDEKAINVKPVLSNQSPGGLIINIRWLVY